MLKMDINAALLEIENLVSSENQENEDLKIYLTKKIKKDGRFYIVSLRWLKRLQNCLLVH